MKVQLVVDEYFSWGVYGGYGAFARKLGRELVKKGIQVEAIVQKISPTQPPVGCDTFIDGVLVKTIPRRKVEKFLFGNHYKTDVDVIHSQSAKLDTHLAFHRNPEAVKVVTIQDLRTMAELKAVKDPEVSSFVRTQWSKYSSALFGEAVREADAVACQAHLLRPKIQKLFKRKNVLFMPNFVDVPPLPSKSERPSVVWLGRLDEIKRPELCLNLAKSFHNVTFNILGKSHDEATQERLQKNYAEYENIHFLGFNDGELKEQVLNEAWILVNTSLYECLPVSFLEAFAHGCAVLSTQNPDNLTDTFGYYCPPSVDMHTDLQRGLLHLLESWEARGISAYRYAKKFHETSKCVQDHINLYKQLIEAKK